MYGRFTSTLVLLLAAGALACSATNSRFSSGSGEGNGNGSGGNGVGGGLSFGGNSSGGGCPTHCSTDLHHVVDCNDQIIDTCADDLGCSPDGTCIAPCAAAAENGSTIGCDFYSVVPGPMNENRGSCFAALIANTWTSPVTISAERGGATFDIDTIARVPEGSGASINYVPLSGGKLDPGKIALVFLSQYNSGDIFWTPCPAGTSAGVEGNAHVAGTGKGSAFRLTTDRPVVAYDIYPYGGASSFVTSATLLVPTPTWGDNFIAADAYAVDPNLAFVNGFPFVQIVAAQAGTTVTINPSAAIVGGAGVTGGPANTPIEYSLGAGRARAVHAERSPRWEPYRGRQADQRVGWLVVHEHPDRHRGV